MISQGNKKISCLASTYDPAVLLEECQGIPAVELSREPRRIEDGHGSLVSNDR